MIASVWDMNSPHGCLAVYKRRPLRDEEVREALQKSENAEALENQKQITNDFTERKCFVISSLNHVHVYKIVDLRYHMRQECNFSFSL